MSRLVVINSKHGGFGLSETAKKRFFEIAGHDFDEDETERDHPALIQVAQELGTKANGEHAALKIVEIPDDIKWGIGEYDGKEWVTELPDKILRTWE